MVEPIGAPDAGIQPAPPSGIDESLREAVWTRVQLARRQDRPHTLELLRRMGGQPLELHGDRLFRDDPAIVGGLGRLDGRPFVFVGHQKGRDTDENIRRNFGMPHPEGYRKALRLFDLAERFRLPLVTFIDTPGAFPGPAAEERGVAESIARSIQRLIQLRTPVVAVITGEGGSGGALALAVGDVVIALENAIYSVISPEGCASILWRTAEAAKEAAVAMRLTAEDQVALGIVDEVVLEPGPGAHAQPEQTARRLRAILAARLDALAEKDLDDILEARYARYRSIGAFETVDVPTARPERPGIGDRLRTLVQIGRVNLGGTEGPALRPQAADEPEDAPLREEL
jgi:acetyl-CoA carboxylase carboxyl transferase subunit alpha